MASCIFGYDTKSGVANARNRNASGRAWQGNGFFELWWWLIQSWKSSKWTGSRKSRKLRKQSSSTIKEKVPKDKDVINGANCIIFRTRLRRSRSRKERSLIILESTLNRFSSCFLFRKSLLKEPNWTTRWHRKDWSAANWLNTGSFLTLFSTVF